MFVHSVDRAAAAPVVGPCGGAVGERRVGDRISPDRRGVVVLAAFQLVPRVVGHSVAVGVLHDPDDARLGRGVHGVALDVKVVTARVGYRLGECRDEVSAPSAERNPVVLGEARGSVPAGFLRRIHVVERAAGARLFVDELSRCGSVFENPGHGFVRLRGRDLFAGVAGGQQKSRQRECVFFHLLRMFFTV